MFITNTINKQTFDFTCPSEAIAAKVQKEIVYNTADGFNDIINEVLTESFPGTELLVIDKLEIDLAETTVEEFENRQMFNSFKQTLQEKIASLVNAKSHIQNKQLPSIADAQLNATIAFLATGYFPWWVDKTADINCDEMMQSIIKERPEALQKFLNENNESVVITRLQQQYKPSTKAALDVLIPGLLKKYNKQSILDNREPENHLTELSTEVLEKLYYIAEKPGTSIKEYKVLSLLKLLREPNNKWINKPGILNILTGEEIHKLELFHSNKDKNKTVKKEAVRILNDLNIFQLEFLLKEVSGNFDEKTAERTSEFGEAKKSLGSSLIEKKLFPSIPTSYDRKSDQTVIESSNTGVGLADSINDKVEQTDHSTKIDTNNTEYYDESIPAEQNRLSKSSIRESAKYSQPKHDKDFISQQGLETISRSTNSEMGDCPGRSDANFDASIAHNESKLDQDNLTQETTKANQFFDINESKRVISNKIENRDSSRNNSLSAATNQPDENKLQPTKTFKSGFIEPNEKKEDETGFKDEVKFDGVPNDLLNIEENFSEAKSSAVESSADVSSETRSFKAKFAATESSAALELKDESRRYTVLQPDSDSYSNSTKTTREKFDDNDPGTIKTDNTLARDEDKLIKVSQSKDATGNEVEETETSENKITQESDDMILPQSIGQKSNKPSDDEINNYISEKNRRVEYIRNKISRSNKGLINELHLLNDHDLFTLEEQFKQFEKLDNQNQILANLIEHPYFFKYDLLKILNAKYILEKDRLDDLKEPALKKKKKKSKLSTLFDTIITTQPAFDQIIENLSAVEAIVLKDIFEKKSFETESEKKIIKKILKRLPEQSINLLHFFTQLPENEMQQFVIHSGRNISESNRPYVANSTYDYSNEGKIHIENAGLCIIATYLPALFRHLQYLENGTFKNKAIATRAIYLIQYITTGKSGSPEYLLQFNKLLCGFKSEEDIHGHIRLTKKEKAEADDLLQSVIENWSTLQNTSLNGFRTSFLQRRGILTENEISWTLQVERKSYDMLLSTISWGYGIIKLAWMKKHIQVEW